MVGGGRAATPFSSPAEAWFWTIAALQARWEGSNGQGGAVPRPCDPDDIILCLDRLYRARRLDQAHVVVLRDWGRRQMAPASANMADGACRLWDEAMACLGWALQQKGIVRKKSVDTDPR